MIGKFGINITKQTPEGTEKQSGMRDGKTLTLKPNEPVNYKLPTSAMLFAIQVKGVGTVEVENIGKIKSKGNAVLQTGLRDVESVRLSSDSTIKVIPIIYTR